MALKRIKLLIPDEATNYKLEGIEKVVRSNEETFDIIIMSERFAWLTTRIQLFRVKRYAPFKYFK
jgi:hypothetical protein